jgi:hypothetical protein
MKTLGTLEENFLCRRCRHVHETSMTALDENNDELVAAGAVSSAHYDTTRASLGLLFLQCIWLPQFRFISLKPMLTHSDQFEACFESVLPLLLVLLSPIVSVQLPQSILQDPVTQPLKRKGKEFFAHDDAPDR